ERPTSDVVGVCCVAARGRRRDRRRHSQRERGHAFFIERERYGTCDPPPPLLQRPPSAVLPRSARMALLPPGADREHVWRGDAPHRQYLSEMYDDDASDAAEAVSATVSVLRDTSSFAWYRGMEARIAYLRPR